MADFYLDYRGSDYNGGGYDSTITGATVNLASGQYAALTASGLECTAGSTTVTSIHGGFTTDMIGNYINIYNGYEYTFHCYAITGVPNSTSLELASSPSPSLDAVSGVGKVGGAWRTLDNLATGGGVLGWGGKSKVPQAGDTVNIRGNGQHNPPSGQYTGMEYISVAGGNQDNPVVYNGYNGRPCFIPIRNNLFWHSSPFCHIRNIKFQGGKGGYETSISQINGAVVIHNCIFDQLGSRAKAFNVWEVTNCYIYNSLQHESDQLSNTHAIVAINNYGHGVNNCVLENLVGNAIFLNCATATRNVINNVSGVGIYLQDNGANYSNRAYFNTVNNCSLTGIQRNGNGTNQVIGNLVTNCSVGIAEIEALQQYKWGISDTIDYNGLYNNDVNYSGYNGGNNDVLLTSDPYVDEGSDNLMLNNDIGGGKDCRAGAAISVAGYAKTRNYQDIGALQAYDK